MTPGRPALRTCIGCRRTAEQDRLLRYVLTPHGQVAVDYRKRLPGRGAYTCLDPACLRQAVQRGQFRRSFKSPGVEASAEQLLEELREGVRQRIRNLLGMARKSGAAVTGSNLVLQELRSRRPLALVILAEESAGGTCDRLTAEAARQQVPVHRFGSREELGELFGRALRSVAGIRPGPLARALAEEMAHLRTVTEGH